ncbi:DUF5753 domain-containing protein, partial [Actinophytocola sp.]|uniref:DUF5753 domain-containing protein n=1 Tax=Actinophytocola sp. TaxID=1872138 RepID=UPI002D7FD10C
MSERLRSLVFHESSATAKVNYAPLVIPGLLQTEAYASALITADIGQFNAPPAVDVRMRRQRILRDPRSPLDGTFYIHEQVLHLPVGGNRVMNEQLLQLVLLAEQPNISIRVVPTALGARSHFGRAFLVLHYRQHRPLGYQESGVLAMFIEDAELVQRFEWKLSRIAAVALGPEQSRELIANAADRYDRPDDPPTPAKDHPARECAI